MASNVPAEALADLAQLLAHGPSLLLVTRDASLRPEIVRAGFGTVTDDGSILIAVPLPEGRRTVANLEDNGVVALSAARPTTYRTLQVKGRGARRCTRPDVEAQAERHRERMGDEIAAVGLDGGITRVFWSHRFAVFAFTPDEIYEQTPGPSAGLAISSR